MGKQGQKPGKTAESEEIRTLSGVDTGLCAIMSEKWCVKISYTLLFYQGHKSVSKNYRDIERNPFTHVLFGC